MRIAEVGIAEIRKHVDTLIVIPNQNLFRVANEKTTFAEAFVLADQVLYSGVACIVDLIIKEGLINLDFADVRTVMSGMGSAVMGTGEASGEQRAIDRGRGGHRQPAPGRRLAARVRSGLLLSITGGSDLTLYEVDEAASRVRQEVDPEANIIVGATFDETLGDRVRVSIVASGMARIERPAVQPPRVRPRCAGASRSRSRRYASGPRRPMRPVPPTRTTCKRRLIGGDRARDEPADAARRACIQRRRSRCNASRIASRSGRLGAHRATSSSRKASRTSAWPQPATRSPAHERRCRPEPGRCNSTRRRL